MKKSLYVAFSVLLASLFAVGCADKSDDFVPSVGGEEEGGTAVFTFTPNFTGSTDTRAMSLQPYDPNDSENHSALKNLFFAVFDAEGFKLSEYAEAIPNTYAQENGLPYSYSVRLTVTDSKRIVHIIANAPESLKYGTEEEVIGSLCTYLDAQETGASDRQDAYWERIVLEHGVHAEPDIALQTDNPTEYARQYAKYKEVVDSLATARLTRNFASVSVVKNKDLSDDKFLLTGFMLVNVPDRGSIAPYNRNLRKFQQEFGKWNSIARMIGDGEDEGNYQGFTPSDANIISYKELTEAQLHARLKVPTSENVYEFCYEREIPESDPLYIIIAGKYNGDTKECYYKIDLKDQNNRYFPILRNFHYRINIESVTAKGAPSIKSALEGMPSGGDISTSLDLQTLTNISNGEAQLLVSSTEEVICNVETADDYILWLYKFVPDITKPNETANKPYQVGYSSPEDLAELEQLKAEHKPYLMIDYKYGETGNVMRTLSVEGETTDGYKSIKFYPEIPGDIVRTAETTVTGYYWSGPEVGGKYETISRSVKFILRKKLEMKLEFLPDKVPDNTNQNLDLRIGLEAGLPQSVFSLDFQIEARKRSLSANITADNHEELPVASGQSSIPGNNEPAFWFTKTITYEDYMNAPIVSTEDGDYKFFTCHFKTLKALQAPNNEDIVYVSNPLFVQNHASYSMYTANEFENLSYSASNPEVGTDVTFSFQFKGGKLPADNKVLVSMFGFEPSTSETQLEYKYSNDEGYEIYEMSVNNTANSIKVSPYSTGYCNIRLDADEFLTSQKDVMSKLTGSQTYNIKVNAVNLYRVNNASNFGNGATISVYYANPQTSSIVHPAKTFQTANSSTNSAFSIDAVPGSTLYFSAEYNGDTYYASASIADLAAATSTARYNMVFTPYPAIRIIESKSVKVNRVNTSYGFDNGAVVNVYDSDPQSGSPVAITTFTVDSNKLNSEFTVPASFTGTLYFTTAYGGMTYYAQADVTDLDNATTSSAYSLVFNTNPVSQIYTLETGSIVVQRAGSNWGNATVSYYFSDPTSGNLTPISSFTTSNGSTNKGRNSSDVEITCPAGTTTVYFKATNSGTAYYGSATIEALDKATTSSRITLNLQK